MSEAYAQDAGADHEDCLRVTNGSVDVDGGLILQEFESVAGTQLPDGHYATVAGFVIDRLGCLSETGDRVKISGQVLTAIGPAWKPTATTWFRHSGSRHTKLTDSTRENAHILGKMQVDQ
ncbi:CBS domain containing-hemolysin-like protein [Arthrobacter sp. V4I6]|uniref:transporter associated domain-containing protein n=1 Tax=unclassified Arthrobacter TaxID=235627 RepID=UPI00278AF660|nr:MULTISPECIES: transporter associated domain-containing protein [unclassified Arthrobacter]MDQ0822532.1 CBS domain containing-hemolysin-like protein [Arthrobacter sp. V1I7]MDQ0852159.1 CBS domain containing-hemolysin-like protein [Arthrobacter sp. V4I6]